MKKNMEVRESIFRKYGIFCGLLSAPLSVIAAAIVFFEKGTETMVLLLYYHDDSDNFLVGDDLDRDCIEENSLFEKLEINEVYPSLEEKK